MRLMESMRIHGRMKLIGLLLAWGALPIGAQEEQKISIGGSVYGGGRQATVKGASTVNLYGNTSNDANEKWSKILIRNVFGGNDISGTVEQKATVNAYGRDLFVGRLYGGGNGDYDYTSEKLEDGGETIDNPYLGLSKPDISKVEINLNGGYFGYVYGGGDNATVTGSTTINLDENLGDVTFPFTMEEVQEAGIRPNYSHFGGSASSNYKSKISRMFGGNNKADMAIQPTWNLKNGSIDRLYCGGNQGRMTHPNGVLLDIKKGSKVIVGNLFGGCRKADVQPMAGGVDVSTPVFTVNYSTENGDSETYNYKFQAGKSTHVLVRGGNVVNVYGGNDVSGLVHGGTSVAIFHDVQGNVYGGGYGNYPYTDNPVLKDNDLYGEYYYGDNVPAGANGIQKIQAMNDFRPNTESVYVELGGTEDEPTIIKNSVFLGAGSATVRKPTAPNAAANVELRVNSHIILGNAYLGNDGEDMVRVDKDSEPEDQWEVLQIFRRTDLTRDGSPFASFDLTDPDQFKTYMDGVTMELCPKVSYDDNYVDYSAKCGSLICGGNVGSMAYEGKAEMLFYHKTVVYDKIVGGCNTASVEATEWNAAYDGGVLGSPAEQLDYTENGKIKDRVVLNVNGPVLRPMKWNDAGTELVPNIEGEGLGARLHGGNIYGGCFTSGHINGNVVINLMDDTVIKDEVFAADGEHANMAGDEGKVDRTEQGMDVFGNALSVFGAGYGKNTEIWGSTTINLKRGFTFQIFGGGMEGAIGKSGTFGTAKYGKYDYDSKYSATVNLCGTKVADSDDAEYDGPESEFIYGGGFEGLIAGDAVVNLGNGRLFNSFGGACNADILGCAETYVGRNSSVDSDTGFPWLREHIYGGNDLGGNILGLRDYKDRVSSPDLPRIASDDATKASAYVEYVQGHMHYIFGGGYGDYPYEPDGDFEDYTLPWIENAFVNFKPNSNSNNTVEKVLGAAQGAEGNMKVDEDDVDDVDSELYKFQDEKNKMQNRSYVLVDIADNDTRFEDMEVFGGGMNCGVGMRVREEHGVSKEEAQANANGVTAAAVVDLARGRIKAAYGGSFQEGVTRRTIVNVPEGSTINAERIFAGAYGKDYMFTGTDRMQACDVFESNLNYSSSDATVRGGYIYGGNNNSCRTIYAHVNVNTPVWKDKSKGELATVYGAGKGATTWAEYTEVNLNSGARVYEVYGGGELGSVANVTTVDNLVALSKQMQNLGEYSADRNDGIYNEDPRLVTKAEDGNSRYNANVRIKKGATVVNYVYGGGFGSRDVTGLNDDLTRSNGNVFGTTYVALLGGEVLKDIYGGGTTGNVLVRLPEERDEFTAGTNVYIESGSVRNVYGGGWFGAVGNHVGTFKQSGSGDIPGETHVVIGKPSESRGVKPTILRNAYGGGEGAPVWGTTNVTVNDGYIGYVDGEYKENIEDKTYMVDNVFQPNERLKDAGNVFGGGYVDNSSVDVSHVKMYGGTVRGSVFGGGECAAVGRGTNNPTIESGEAHPINTISDSVRIFKAGETHLEIYGGKVLRNVFGGGRGFNNIGQTGTFGTDGYIFGSTEVRIRGGEIGTKEGVGEGYGNVFGGGDVGYVYSGVGQKCGERDYDDPAFTNGKPKGAYYIGGDSINNNMTEDCKVVIEPYAKVTGSATTIDGTSYEVGQYVPQTGLNTLGKTDPRWQNLDQSGVTVYNAVFGGGNVSEGSDRVFVNANTVYGNATASVRDIYSFDLISIGGEHVGGIYGDGNLTFVDGYRELNISNYGTDYYRLQPIITQAEFESLNVREQAYYKLNYKCLQDCTDKNGHKYKMGDELLYSEVLELFKGTDVLTEEGTPDAAYWTTADVKNIYRGRLMNTVQRADMVGVFGSRLVMQGAQDRVPSKADYTNYTINRVGEVSLNLQDNALGITDQTNTDYSHGNYFGIYNVVNFLGNLTSDVSFLPDGATRTADTSEDANKADGSTYYNWKLTKRNAPNRNNGTSQNEVDLAAGVYLEITREPKTENDEEKHWGYITGVIQLGLLDASPGAGGGYVYAKNQHGRATVSSGTNKVNLSEFNEDACTYRDFKYATSSATDYIETSGNFVHPTKRIVDDCYPESNRYFGANAAPAHYWYIKGEIYVYDEYISAYTGSANAYLEAVNIPLTISATSRGKIQLIDVKPNLYATQATTVLVNGITQTLQAGDAIDWWSYDQLSAAQKGAFAETVYTIAVDCTIDGTEYTAGTVLTEDQYTTLKAYNNGNHTVEVRENPDADFDFVVRLANNLSHSNGYVLTNKFDNPAKWDFTAPAPTFSTNSAGVYGQRNYTQGEIVYGSVVDKYNDMDKTGLTNQATMEKAYVVTAEVKVVNKDGTEQHLFPGAPVVESDYTDEVWASISGKVSEAKVVTSTLKLSETDYLYVGSLLSAADITALNTTLKEMNTGWSDSDCENYLEDYLDVAYYCTTGGLYGGSYFNTNTQYSALDSWCSLSEDDRTSNKFSFNYDALNVLIDEQYAGNMDEYDGPNAPKVYSAIQPIDYKADYLGTEALTWTDKEGTPHTIAARATEIPREVLVPNEQMHFSELKASETGTYHVVTKQFTLGNLTYTVGQMLDDKAYKDITTLTDKESYFKEFEVTDERKDNPYYFCYEKYEMNERGECTGVTITDVLNEDTYTTGDIVPFGTIIDKSDYESLPNLEKDGDGKDRFLIYGPAPKEESSLYVARQSNIYDLSKEKILTVVYQYDYRESDESGLHFTPVTEKHIVNIHINFKTGVPYVGELNKPSVVLPGSTVGLKIPTVTPGAFEVTSSGWEIFTNEEDANEHRNGRPYYNNVTPLYWYQDNYWVAYYAQTYLGKTYSNAVPFTVANYHDLKALLDDKEHHYYIDHEHAFKERNPKIYINEPAEEELTPENRLDLLKDLFDLTTQTYDGETQEASVIDDADSRINGHTQLEKHVKGCANLDIILRTNIDHSTKPNHAYHPVINPDVESVLPADPWKPIGTASQCFEGTLHGDGYTITNLDNSLFGYLCGSVYNLGVMGSFKGAGLADTGDGYVENCWISTNSTEARTAKPVFGDPTRTSGYQIVNCYYQEEKDATNKYTNHSGTYGIPTRMDARAFNNGTVAYNLNGFYLYKRYNDGKNQATGLDYQYWKSGSEQPLTGYYATNDGNAQYCSTGYNGIKYVEERYADGDFIYAGGTIPEEQNVRLVPESTDTYCPIWPDDYLFFGQMLTYGYSQNYPHENVPSHIRRDASQGRLLTTPDNNRVYRAPAYFRNSEMNVAHFNPNAIFAQTTKNHPDSIAYKDMTAIDFTGGNGDLDGGYQLAGSDKFYAPLLDEDGLTGFRNVNLTRNLLAYTGDEGATHDAVNGGLPEVEYREINAEYRNVALADYSATSGHQVVNRGGNYVTEKDHLLVDRNDFNAPIAYKMGSGLRMWYQRMPDNYVDLVKGWEGISLPFTAELVTTNDKGEITHFYAGSEESKDEKHTKIGHEYWLREFNGIDESASTDEGYIAAQMEYPGNGSLGDKTVDNTFLWDYYYSKNTRRDEHDDTYQTYYEKRRREYKDYGYLTNGKPYIVGFPSPVYYEFDLSGHFVAQHTATVGPEQLRRQTVTFASFEGTNIAKSDNETAGVTADGYTFVPSYLNKRFEAGAAYVLNDVGSSYDVAGGNADAFRPYFQKTVSPARRMAQSIVFTNELSEMRGYDIERDADNAAGGLTIEGKRNKIVVTSTLTAETQVRIVTVAGAPLITFSIKPGETIETDVHADGIYIVQAADGRYTKKLAIK